MTPKLIFCAGGNKKYVQIAIDSGFLYGTQLPNKIYFQPYFVDQNWKNPNRKMYMESLSICRPFVASVIDWEQKEQLSEVLSWADEATQFVETVMIIPKVQGGISLLPRTIGGKPIILGYSIPTKYGGTALPYNDFLGWPVHLLGGSPHKQMQLSHYMNVISVDGNMQSRMASSCRYWRSEKGPHGHWINMYEVGDKEWGEGANYEAFRRSCKNIMEAWKGLNIISAKLEE